MTRRRFDSSDDWRVLTLLSRAAERGSACPDNAAIAGALGAKSVSAGPACLARLARRGLIVVTRYQSARKVRIVATGAETATPANAAPHWRDRDGVRPRAKVRTNRKASAAYQPKSETLPEPVSRDPCPFCGVRRDVGCRHAERISMGAFA